MIPLLLAVARRPGHRDGSVVLLLSLLLRLIGAGRGGVVEIVGCGALDDGQLVGRGHDDQRSVVGDHVVERRM